MGLNTWDSFRYWASEDNVLANAKVLQLQGLVGKGWKYLVIDEGWFIHDNNSDTGMHAGGAPNFDPMNVAIDAYGRYTPADRFPSARGGLGFGPLCGTMRDEYGVLCGVHLSSGVPQRAVEVRLPIQGTNWTADQIVARPLQPKAGPAAWWAINVTHPGAAAYYASVVDQLAGWGVRYLKLDFGPSTAEIAAIQDVAPQSLVLSVNGAPNHDCSQAGANLYRISTDVWDVWGDVDEQFAAINHSLPYARPGCWPDADMLPLGRVGGMRNMSQAPYPPGACTPRALSCDRTDNATYRYQECCPRQSRLSLTETQSLLSLWLIARSPLMMGGYLPETAAEVLEMLGNELALEVGISGDAPHWLPSEPAAPAFASRATKGGGSYLAVFNRAELSAAVSVGVGMAQGCELADLWAGGTPGTAAEEEVPLALECAPAGCQVVGTLPAHGSALLRMSAAGGGSAPCELS
jgi:hypothetical protein